MVMDINMRIILGAALAILVSAQAFPHHSFSRFDRDKIIEVEGELLEYTWRNPHVSFKLSEIDATGKERIWQIESNSLSILRRTNVSPEHLKKGDKIRVAGWTTRRPSNELFIHNLLTPDGREMLLEFDLENNRLNVRTYSPFLDAYQVDANSQFSMEIDFDNRLRPAGN